MKKSIIYTRTGDKGTTSLVGGQRVSKAHDRIESYGTVDFLPKNRCKVSWNGHFQMNREMQPITRHSMCLSPILLDRGALVPHPPLSVSIKTLQNITKTNTPMPE